MCEPFRLRNFQEPPTPTPCPGPTHLELTASLWLPLGLFSTSCSPAFTGAAVVSLKLQFS